MPDRFTAITFSPVQGFIEKSRKLRDLYGSSYLLSYLAGAICDSARQALGSPTRDSIKGYPVISPALINQTQGTPNNILIAGELPENLARASLEAAWAKVVAACQQWIEETITTDLEGNRFDYCWRREWALWKTYAWEFFWATGDSIATTRAALNEQKRRRDWTGVNWVSESSSLSGADGIAYPEMGKAGNPKSSSPAAENQKIQAFYQALSQQVGEAIITPREKLSIPELVKRLVTTSAIGNQLPQVESPGSYRWLNRWREEDTDIDRADTKLWTGWFQGDGDRAGEYLRGKSAQQLNDFSYALREWGRALDRKLPLSPSTKQIHDGRIIYAGGDDFLGVLYRNDPTHPLQPLDCLNWFYPFKSQIWSQHQQPISVSVGFVWAAPNVPQRDVLQHCRKAEKSAKTNGRDRIALRILFNSGNYLEWVCPWRLLPLLQDYRSRSSQSGSNTWTHFYNDVAVLQARHAFSGNQSQVAKALLQVYFKPDIPNSNFNRDDRVEFYEWLNADTQDIHQPLLWNSGHDGDLPIAGILGSPQDYYHRDTTTLDATKVHNVLNDWMINLAKVGFHLCSPI